VEEAPAFTFAVNEAVPKDTVAPPLEAVYQSIVQPVAVEALKVTVPDPQRVLLLALVGAPGRSCTTSV
jgi:ribosomal protein L23